MKFSILMHRVLIVALLAMIVVTAQAQQQQRNSTAPYVTYTLPQQSQTGPRSSLYDHVLVLYASGNGYNDLTRIFFGPLFTDTFDSQYDAVKIMSRAGQPNIWTLAVDSVKRSVNALPPLVTPRNVITAFTAGTNGNFTIRFDSLRSFDPSQLIYWEDRNLHTLKNIRADSTYSFTSNTADSANRFILHFGPTVATSAVAGGCVTLGSVQVNLGLFNINGSTIYWDSYVLKNASNQTVDSVAHASGTINSNNLAAGSYTVKLSINGYVTTIPVTVPTGGGGVTAAFTADSSTLHIGSAVNFTNSSTGATSYSWSFGDNSTSSATTPPAHTYSTTGTYAVTLIATGTSCNDTVSHTITVLNNPVVVATSTGAVCGGTGAVQVNLDLNHVDNPPAIWNSYVLKNAIGATVDSQTNVSSSVTTSGLQPGIYTIKLTRNGNTVTLLDTVHQNGSVTATFTTDSTTIHVGSSITFTNSSSGATSYAWNFGDGVTAGFLTPPPHAYNLAGTYTITLLVTNGGCRDSISKTITVLNNPTVVATSTAAACGGTGTITVNLDEFHVDTPPAVWDLYVLKNSLNATVDSQTNVSASVTTAGLQPGIYSINLTKTGHLLTLLDTVIQVGSVVAAFTTDSASYHVSGTVVFTSTSTGAGTYSWDFGDQSTLGSSSIEQHSYASPGSYTVHLIIHNGTCADTTSRTVVVKPNPTQSATSTSAGCTTNGTITVNLDVTQVDSIPATWNTYIVANGAGATVDSQTNVSGTVTTNNLPSGPYTVTISRNGHSVVLHDTIAFVNGVSASFSVDSSTVHSGNTVNFNNTSTGATSYFWNFGDGDTLSGSGSTTHVFDSVGTFTVWLIAKNGSCIDSVSITVTVVQTVHPGIAEAETGELRISSSGNTIMVFATGVNFNNATLVIYDTPGKELFRVINMSLTGKRTEINPMMNLEGYYFVQLIGGNKVYTGKVLLTRAN